MKTIGTSLVFLVELLAMVLGGDGTVGQFPPGLISEVVGNATNLTMDNVGACGDPNKSDYKLLLYSRANPFAPITLTDRNLNRVDPRKTKTVIAIHGYFSSPTSFGFPEIKDAYLFRHDCNVIMVDWSSLAWPRLTTAICYLPKMAPLLADTLCRSKLPLAKFHLVGHSLGAQMSGLIGSNTAELCGQRIGRITALDPGGPLYPEFPESQRLDKSDALFVDVIHTNAGGMGFWGNTGHADFYVNCGSLQPGCRTFDRDHVIDHPPAMILCDHFRSVEYMAESINSRKFKAQPCPTCPLPCVANALVTAKTIMGEDCPRNASGAYVLSTNADAPYAKG